MILSVPLVSCAATVVECPISANTSAAEFNHILSAPRIVLGRLMAFSSQRSVALGLWKRFPWLSLAEVDIFYLQDPCRTAAEHRDSGDVTGFATRNQRTEHAGPVAGGRMRGSDDLPLRRLYDRRRHP